MKLFQSMRMALKSIYNSKVRAFLTMLGIIIDVSSVVILVSVGQGGSWLLGKYTSLTVSIAWDMVMISFVFSLLIGVIFGMMPANKAARLRPIHALRNE
ncbi:hypothetical protein NST74_08260 [Paenibacillus sp. FSL F4-0125]|uniref:ABC transporter permease n=1 Tax=Paenibacillus sp. FSL F4-0125 TaxID=2954730 RepID=UPI0030F79E96